MPGLCIILHKGRNLPKRNLGLNSKLLRCLCAGVLRPRVNALTSVMPLQTASPKRYSVGCAKVLLLVA